MTSMNENDILPEDTDTALDNHSPQKKELNKELQKSPTRRQNSYQKVIEETLEQTVEKLDKSEAKKQNQAAAAQKGNKDAVSKKLDLNDEQEEGNSEKESSR